jgi:O-antigen ligase
MSFYLIYRFNQKLIKKISSWQIFFDKKIILKLIPIMLLVIYLFAIFLGLFFFSKFDSRMENLFNLDFYKNRNLFSIANDFVFAERILYWQTGWKIFNDYPIFGVGLGNSGFFFNDYMPSFAWALDEPRHLIFQANYQGNIKNLWFRLLSETGALGFLSFATWMLLIFFLSNRLEKGDNPSQNYWGLVGKIAIIALIIEGFSIDSFALPYYWILLGLVSSNFKDVEATIN